MNLWTRTTVFSAPMTMTSLIGVTCLRGAGGVARRNVVDGCRKGEAKPPLFLLFRFSFAVDVVHQRNDRIIDIRDLAHELLLVF